MGIQFHFDPGESQLGEVAGAATSFLRTVAGQELAVDHPAGAELGFDLATLDRLAVLEQHLELRLPAIAGEVQLDPQLGSGRIACPHRQGAVRVLDHAIIDALLSLISDCRILCQGIFQGGEGGLAGVVVDAHVGESSKEKRKDKSKPVGSD